MYDCRFRRASAGQEVSYTTCTRRLFLWFRMPMARSRDVKSPLGPRCPGPVPRWPSRSPPLAAGATEARRPSMPGPPTPTPRPAWTPSSRQPTLTVAENGVLCSETDAFGSQVGPRLARARRQPARGRHFCRRIHRWDARDLPLRPPTALDAGPPFGQRDPEGHGPLRLVERLAPAALARRRSPARAGALARHGAHPGARPAARPAGDHPRRRDDRHELKGARPPGRPAAAPGDRGG